MRYLFGTMPREVAIPRRRLVGTWSDFVRHVNAANGFVPVFGSVYSFDDYPNYNSAVVDKVAFDLDGLGKWYAVRRVHMAAEQRGWEHAFVFSGGGYHCYIFAEPQPLRYPQSAIRRFQDAMQQGFALPMDVCVHSGTALCMRVPGTWNHRRQRFCYAIPREMLDRERPDAVIRAAATQHLNTPEQCVFPGERVRLSRWDIELEELRSLDLPEVEATTPAPVVVHDPFVAALVGPDMGHEDRGRLIFWLIEEGYTINEITNYLKTVLSEDKYRHCVFEERQPQRIMERYG